jgi:hypothetical protein
MANPKIIEKETVLHNGYIWHEKKAEKEMVGFD